MKLSKRFLTLLAVVGLVFSSIAPAGAITRGGELDGEDHPYVGLMVLSIDGNPAWRCSGALISPTVFVTAGHCTSGADSAMIWFESDLEPDPAAHGYPFTGGVTGTPHAHPDYIDAAFWAFDLGVVILDEPVVLDEYAELSDLGAVDSMGKGRKKANVDAVGYGLQKIIEGNPFDPDVIAIQADKTRYQATLMVVNTKGVAGLGSITPGKQFTVSGDAKHGGTCFGDSGGPMLLAGTNQIVGVNSFGLNANCAGIGGIYRVDTVDSQDWINSFLD